MWPGIIGGALGYKILRYFHVDPFRKTIWNKNPYLTKNKLEVLFGPLVWSQTKGNVVIDFGCGDGTDVIEIAKHGALKVIGIDVREKLLKMGREAAEQAAVGNRCIFTTNTDEKADRILSVDGFEHYDDPEKILSLMRRLIKQDGRILISFGPIWYHPYGSHLYGLYPWSHLLFTEKAIMRWRADFKSDGAKFYREVEGGLNQMTIRKFRKIVDCSDFKIEKLEEVPIRKTRFLHNRLTREFLTSNIRCQLIPR